MQRPASILVIAFCAALLAGCAADPVAEVTPTPAFASEAEAFAAAEATYRAYVDALNQVDLADPETFEAVYAWTTGDLSARDRRNLSQMHASGQSVFGDSQIVTVTLSAADLAEDRYDLAVCVDVSEVDVTNSSGATVVDPARVDIQSTTVQLRRSAATDTGLAIEAIVGRDGDPTC